MAWVKRALGQRFRQMIGDGKAEHQKCKSVALAPTNSELIAGREREEAELIARRPRTKWAGAEAEKGAGGAAWASHAPRHARVLVQRLAPRRRYLTFPRGPSHRRTPAPRAPFTGLATFANVSK